jgi:hypothetical protein
MMRCPFLAENKKKIDFFIIIVTTGTLVVEVDGKKKKKKKVIWINAIFISLVHHKYGNTLAPFDAVSVPS